MLRRCWRLDPKDAETSLLCGSVLLWVLGSAWNIFDHLDTDVVLRRAMEILFLQLRYSLGSPDCLHSQCDWTYHINNCLVEWEKWIRDAPWIHQSSLSYLFRRKAKKPSILQSGIRVDEALVLTASRPCPISRADFFVSFDTYTSQCYRAEYLQRSV